MLLNAAAGLGISTYLGATHGIVAVGQFNLLFALYLLAGQITSCGVHLSCLHYQALGVPNALEWKASAHAACVVTLLTGVLGGGVLWLCANPLANLLKASNVAPGIAWLACAAALLGLNKVVFSLYNAADNLLRLAFLQGVRPIVWSGGLLGGLYFKFDIVRLFGVVFGVGEGVVLFLGIMLWPLLWRPLSTPILLKPWILRHIRFGLKAAPSHALIDLNAKLDVVLVSAMTNEAAVGVYSFVALLAEGVFQGSVLIRTVITHRLVRLLAAGDMAGLRRLVFQAGGWNVWFTLAASLILLALFSPAVSFFHIDPHMMEGKSALSILLGGIVASAFWAPFWMNLLLAGYPLTHTVFMLLLCCVNVMLNLALIPLWGINGAALGTAAMFVVMPIILSFFMRKILGFHMLSR